VKRRSYCGTSSFPTSSRWRARLPSEPCKEQHVFQLGVVCLDPDAAWIAEEPEFDAFIELP